MDEELVEWKRKLLEVTEKPEAVVVDLVTWSKRCSLAYP